MSFFPSRTDREARRWMLAGAATACLCTGACSHLDPYGTSSQARPAHDDRRRILAPSGIAAPDDRGVRYVSTMQDALERVDEYRLVMQDQIRRVGSERDLYDAALWLAVPLLAFSPAPRDVTKGAALLGAGYGYLNTRPKEQVPILYDAIGRLTCLMVDYTPYLYTTRDFGELEPGGLYSRRHAELVDAIRSFEMQAGAFLDAVPLEPPRTDTANLHCANKFSAACEERRKAHATSTPGNQSKIDDVRDYIERQAGDADAEATALAKLENRILYGAPVELREKADFVRAAAGRAAYDARPALVAPDTLLGARAGTPAASAAAAHIGRRTRTGAGLPPLAARNDMVRALRTGAEVAARRLADARRTAQAFMAVHEERVAASARVSRQYCAQYVLAVPGAAAAGAGDGSRSEPLER